MHSKSDNKTIIRRASVRRKSSPMCLVFCIFFPSCTVRMKYTKTSKGKFTRSTKLNSTGYIGDFFILHFLRQTKFSGHPGNDLVCDSVSPRLQHCRSQIEIIIIWQTFLSNLGQALRGQFENCRTA